MMQVLIEGVLVIQRRGNCPLLFASGRLAVCICGDEITEAKDFQLPATDRVGNWSFCSTSCLARWVAMKAIAELEARNAALEAAWNKALGVVAKLEERLAFLRRPTFEYVVADMKRKIDSGEFCLPAYDTGTVRLIVPFTLSEEQVLDLRSLIESVRPDWDGALCTEVARERPGFGVAAYMENGRAE